MGDNLDFITALHTRTQRKYMERVIGVDKAACAARAKQFGKDYWDGDRSTGYGGYYYDGRWRSVAEKLACHYRLKAGDRILDVGCGKGFLLYELTQAVPGVVVAGLDISAYAIEHAKPEVQPFLQVGHAKTLPWPDHSFELVLCINTLHNLYLYDLVVALKELQRVGNEKRYVLMDSYRNETERVNLMYWQLTCECFFTPVEWEWLFQLSGYTGDYGFIYFE